MPRDFRKLGYSQASLWDAKQRQSKYFDVAPQ